MDGINNKTHAWISKFLTCREQRVVVSGEHSPRTHVKSGVPQDTVLARPSSLPDIHLLFT